MSSCLRVMVYLFVVLWLQGVRLPVFACLWPAGVRVCPCVCMFVGESLRGRVACIVLVIVGSCVCMPVCTLACVDGEQA